jgi:glycosyltransferase involved in cell wall biosynthesis
MADLPRISIITPSYNQAAYLEQTICSVLDQGYPNLEYLVVDGGSTDGSVRIIEKYASQLTWWVSEKDQGQGDAINKGLTRASGDVVAWINSDDYYLPGTFHQIAKTLQSNPGCGLIYGDVLAVDAAGKTINVMRYGHYGLIDLMAFSIIGQSSVFMRQSIQQAAGGLEPGYHYLLDHHLWVRMACRASMFYFPNVFSAARYHADAKNIAQAARFGEEALRIADWMEEYPQTSELFLQNRRRIMAGAYLFNGRYLLDGGLTIPAIRSYMKSIAYHSGTGLKEWHRLAYAFGSLVGLSFLRKLYLSIRRRLRSRLDPDLYNSPKDGR